jgi:hypothetical protein
MIIALAGYYGTSTNETATTGYTLVASQTFGTGSSQQWGVAEYKIVTSSQSSSQVTLGTTISSSGWAMIVDAVKQAS